MVSETNQDDVGERVAGNLEGLDGKRVELALLTPSTIAVLVGSGTHHGVQIGVGPVARVGIADVWQSPLEQSRWIDQRNRVPT